MSGLPGLQKNKVQNLEQKPIWRISWENQTFKTSKTRTVCRIVGTLSREGAISNF